MYLSPQNYHPIQYDNVLRDLLSREDRAIARLDGVLGVLPNPELFVAMFVKKEAVLSSQIEGTQASLQGVLEFEANLIPSEDIKEIKEVLVQWVNLLLNLTKK